MPYNDPYSMEAFFERAMILRYREMFLAADNACAGAEGASYNVRGAANARAAGSVEYAKRLKAFLFWLRYGAKPDGVDEYDWSYYHKIAQRLVEIGDFKPSILQLWNDENA